MSNKNDAAPVDGVVMRRIDTGGRDVTDLPGLWSEEDVVVPSGQEAKAMLWHGKSCEVPVDVAVCPECGSRLYAYNFGWHTDTGQPIAADLQIDCDAENEEFERDEDAKGHRWWQSDWQAVRDAVVKWAMADTSVA